MHEGTEGEQPHYPTPEELWQMTFATQNNWRDRFAAVPFEDRGGYFQGRYYQDIAVERVLEAIADNRERILLTLATGTGKTFIAFQLAWKLFHSRWNLSREATRRPRILFLADRNTLANQAYNPFSAFSRRRAGAHRTKRHQKERPRSQKRQPVFHHLPNVYERPWRHAILWRIPAGLFRFHHH